MNGVDHELEVRARYRSPRMMRLLGIMTAIGLVAMLGGVIAGAMVHQIHPSLTNRLLGIGSF